MFLQIQPSLQLSPAKQGVLLYDATLVDCCVVYCWFFVLIPTNAMHQVEIDYAKGKGHLSNFHYVCAQTIMNHDPLQVGMGIR